MTYDVIIAGAGPSGMTAALAAARNGASVLLIEKNGFLGGMNTAALVCPLMTFHAGPVQVVAGIAEEIVRRLAEQGGCLGHIPDPLGVVSTITPIEPEVLKQVYFQMAAQEPNITLLLHSTVHAVQVCGRGVQSVACANKCGLQTFEGRFFIDATGDGDMAAMAGADFEEGRQGDQLSQPMTMMFKLGGVDFGRVRRYIRENPDQFVLREQVDLDGYLAVSGYFDIVKRARDSGGLSIARDRVLLFEGIRPGEAFVNMTRVIKLRGTDAQELTQAEVIARGQVDEVISFLTRDIDGFADCFLIQSAAAIGVRESRRFITEYRLTLQDVLDGRDFADGVAACAFPIDIHDPEGKELHWIRTPQDNYYTIPYRTMVLPGFDNLLVTGRCIGASHEAMSSSRVTPTAMALGQAAGTAAAMAVAQDWPSLADIPIEALRQALRAQGAIVHKF